jgi:hypothetical protein
MPALWTTDAKKWPLSPYPGESVGVKNKPLRKKDQNKLQILLICKLTGVKCVTRNLHHVKLLKDIRSPIQCTGVKTVMMNSAVD